MRKRIPGILLFVVLVSALTFPTLAEGGDGSGGGSEVGLALATSSVPDGSTGVGVDSQIVLTFNKNVVNFTVKDSNMTCFALSNAGGIVPISVLMGDDQVDPDIKRIITIQPNNLLSPDTTYTLTISRNLTSKSGSSLSQDVVITFTTVAAPVSPSPAVSPAQTTSAAPAPSAATPSNVSVSPTPTVSPTEETQTSPIVEEASEKPSPTPSASPMPTSAPDATETTAALTPTPDETPSPDMADDASTDDTRSVSPIVYIIGSAAVIIIAGTVWVVIRKRK